MDSDNHAEEGGDEAGAGAIEVAVVGTACEVLSCHGPHAHLRSDGDERWWRWLDGLLGTSARRAVRETLRTGVPVSRATRDGLLVISPTPDQDGRHPGCVIAVVGARSPHRAETDDESAGNHSHRTHRLIYDGQLEALGTLLAGVNHGFSHVLQLSQMGIDLLAQGDSAREEGLGLLRACLDEGGTLTDLVRTFCRDLRTEITMVDLAADLRRFVVLFRTSCKDGRLEARLPEGPCLVRGHRGRLHQVVIGLFMNALQARGDRPAHIVLGLHSSTQRGVDGYEVEVTDHGNGLPPEWSDRVFGSSFSTPGPSSTRRAGVGLAVVRSIVEDHGGHIALTSTPGEGTRVSVWLPKRELRSSVDVGQRPETPL